MNGIAPLLLLFLSLQTSTQSAAPDAARASLQGIVKHAKTGAPVPDFRVTLSFFPPQLDPKDGPVPFVRPVVTAASYTNNRGEFVFNDIEAGNYQLDAARDGYVKQALQRITLAPGQAMKDVSLRTRATGNISGRVVNLAGRPAPGVSVVLVRRTYGANGPTGFTSIATVQTNDLGEYRMFWVTPGRYYIVAAPVSNRLLSLFGDERSLYSQGVRDGNNTVSENWIMTFYPGVRDAGKATLIDLQEGAELRNIDFNVTRQNRYTIRGRVVDSTTGKPPSKATIYLSGTSLTGSYGTSNVRSYDAETGAFELAPVAPGRYGLSLRPDGQMTMGAPRPGILWASAFVTVEDRNVDDVVLNVAPQLAINGRLKFEGNLAQPTSLEGFYIGLTTAKPFQALPFFGNSSAAPKADATFALSTVPEGEFRVTMTEIPAGFYLKEALLDGKDVLNKASPFSGTGNLDVTISSNAGQVEVRAVDEQGKPARVETVLIPDTGRDRPELYKYGVTDAAGKLTIASIPPGSYKLFAFRQLDRGWYFEPELLEKLESHGTPVVVNESSRLNVEVKIIPEEALP